MGTDYYDGSGGHPDYTAYDARGAALSVGIAMALAVVFIYTLKKSGFRAMVAVGRG